MNNSRASLRYAKSLLTLSLEKKILEIVKKDVEIISDIFRSSREISNLYLSPIIPINHKLKITNKIFEKKINQNTLNLLNFLVLRKRDNLIESILIRFKELYNSYHNIEESHIYSTSKLDEKELDIIKKFAENLTSKKIVLKNNIDDTLIGGFNLIIGDKMIDCSVSSKLKNLRKKLIIN